MAGDRKDVNRERNNDGADDDDCQRMAAKGEHEPARTSVRTVNITIN